MINCVDVWFVSALYSIGIDACRIFVNTFLVWSVAFVVWSWTNFNDFSTLSRRRDFPLFWWKWTNKAHIYS